MPWRRDIDYTLLAVLQRWKACAADRSRAHDGSNITGQWRYHAGDAAWTWTWGSRGAWDFPYPEEPLPPTLDFGSKEEGWAFYPPDYPGGQAPTADNWGASFEDEAGDPPGTELFWKLGSIHLSLQPVDDRPLPTPIGTAPSGETSPDFLTELETTHPYWSIQSPDWGDMDSNPDLIYAQVGVLGFDYLEGRPLANGWLRYSPAWRGYYASNEGALTEPSQYVTIATIDPWETSQVDALEPEEEERRLGWRLPSTQQGEIQFARTWYDLAPAVITELAGRRRGQFVRFQ